MKVVTFVDTPYKNAFMQGMHEQRQNEEYTDVTLLSGDIHIQCHRNVLAVSSDCFKAMFRSGLEESRSASVQLTIEPDILTTVIDYIYTGEIALTVDNVESLVKACDFLQLTYLMAACEEFMSTQVERDNCFGFYRFASLYRLEKLRRTARQVILSEFRFRSTPLMDEFKELSCADLIDIIKRDDLNVEDEDLVLEGVLGWVHHDLDNRRSSFEAIIQHVRLPYCSPGYLRHVKGKSDVITSECCEYLHEALTFQTDTDVGIDCISPRAHYQVPRLLLVGGERYENNNYIEYNHSEYYEEDTSCWQSLSDLPEPVSDMYSVCRVDDGLVMTGGLKGCVVAEDRAWFYGLDTNVWEPLPPLITARGLHGSVSLGDCVYVVGGQGVGWKVLDSVECFSLTRRQWSPVCEMPKAVYVPAVASYGTRIFVFGGRDAPRSDLSCTQVFDSVERQWTTVAETPDVCCLGAAVTLNDHIYVVGGLNRTCLKYDPAVDSWTRMNRPSLGHGYAPAVVWRGSVLVAGGDLDDQKASTVVEQFDPVTDTWSVCTTADLNKALRQHFMFVVYLSHV